LPTVLPFRARFGSSKSLYIPGEDDPRPLPPDTRLASAASLFIYRQRFCWPGEAVENSRIGVMGVLDPQGSCILPHEETIAERVNAICCGLAGRAYDPGPLWLWCNDPDDSLAHLIEPNGAPELAAEDRMACIHEYWSIGGSRGIETIQDALDGRPLFLADGHHRHAAGWKLAAIQIRNRALRSLAPHRLLTNAIDAESIPGAQPIDDISDYLANAPEGKRRFVVYAPDSPPLGFEMEHGASERRWLNAGCTPVRDRQYAIDAVRNGAAACALLASAPSVGHLEQDALKGRLLPAKSTDFYPKLAAGLVIHCDQ
jgi:uncharacterized protein (DUF1015 family)